MTDRSPDAYTRTADEPPLGIFLLCAVNSLIILIALLAALLIHPLAFLVVAILSIVDIIKIYGLWTLKPWGWWLAMVLYALSLGLGFIEGNVFGFLFAGIVLAYLWAIRDAYNNIP